MCTPFLLDFHTCFQNLHGMISVGEGVIEHILGSEGLDDQVRHLITYLVVLSCDKATLFSI